MTNEGLWTDSTIETVTYKMYKIHWNTIFTLIFWPFGNCCLPSSERSSRCRCSRQKDSKTETFWTRSSATAEKQRVSYTRLPGLVSWPSDDHTWRYNAQNTTESQMLCYFLTFKSSDSKNAGRKRILTWNSHSKSFKVIYFAVICRPTGGSISS